MIKININKEIKPKFAKKVDLLKKILIKKGWDVSPLGNVYINQKGENEDCISYDEYEDTFKPHYSRYFNLQ